MKKIIQILLPLILAGETLLAGELPANILVSRVIEQKSVQQAAMQGVLYFDRISGVSTEVDGLVKSVSFSKGKAVKAGDILVQLNTEFTEKDIALKETEIQSINIRLEHTKKNLNRYENLFSQDAISETDFEDLSCSYKELKKKREALQTGLDKIRLKKAKSTIYAPFDGIILEKSVDTGAWISHGTVFCKIGSTSDLFVNVPVNETLLKFIETGSTMDITINAYDRKVTGRVEGILPLADKKTKSVSLKVRLPAQNMTVANMSATAYVPTSVKKNVKLVPRDALINIGGKNYIYTVIEEKASRLPLDILFFKGEYAYSDSSNLFSGMVVVVDGNQRLKNNQQVTVTGGDL